MNSRSLIVLCIAFISVKAHAQVQFSFFAGTEATSARYLVRENKQPAEFKSGLMGGVALKVEFDNQLYFYPAVYYSHKGYKVTLNDAAFPPTEFAKNNNTSLQTIEIAPLLHYDFNKKLSHLFVRFGPAVDIAFSGQEKFDTVSLSGNKSTISRPMVFSFGDYGRFSAQAIVHFGYETGKGPMIFLFYEHGFGSMNNADGGPKIFHRIVGISFGWLFGRNPLVFDTRPIR
jgi:hypothetical protein